MKHSIAPAAHSSWSLRPITRTSSRNGVCEAATVTCCLVNSSVNDWKPSISTTSSAAKASHPSCSLPSSPPSAFVAGTTATTTENKPRLAQILAITPMRSRSFRSWERAGSMPQKEMSLMV